VSNIKKTSTLKLPKKHLARGKREFSARLFHQRISWRRRAS
jgi:hypothetical protein